MEIEPVRPRMTASRRDGLVRRASGTQTRQPSASMRPERPQSLHRRLGQPGQHGGVLRPPVRCSTCFVALAEPPAREQAHEARLHRGQDLRDVQGRHTRSGMKVQGTRAVSREHPVEHERVYMDVQIERAAGPLNDRHGAAATICDTRIAPARAEEPEDGAHEDAYDSATEIMIPRQLIPHAVRQAEDPLSHDTSGST